MGIHRVEYLFESSLTFSPLPLTFVLRHVSYEFNYTLSISVHVRIWLRVGFSWGGFMGIHRVEYLLSRSKSEGRVKRVVYVAG